MDGLLEKFVPSGHRGVQLIAYSWELADSILSVVGGCVVMGDRQAAVTTESLKPTRPSNPLFSPNPEHRVCHL
jgi:hypothetical protein